MPSMLPLLWQLSSDPASEASSPEVKQLQQQLSAAGFEPGKVDGVFGPRTKAAVMAFQRARGLEVDGVVGLRTWAVLSPALGARPRPLLKRGVREPAAVGALQKGLAAHGFEPGSQEGLFCPKTERAVMAFQRAKGLEADGIVGPKTWAALGLTAERAFPVPKDAAWRVWSGAQSERLNGPRSDFPPAQAG